MGISYCVFPMNHCLYSLTGHSRTKPEVLRKVYSRQARETKYKQTVPLASGGCYSNARVCICVSLLAASVFNGDRVWVGYLFWVIKIYSGIIVFIQCQEARLEDNTNTCVESKQYFFFLVHNQAHINWDWCVADHKINFDISWKGKQVSRYCTSCSWQVSALTQTHAAKFPWWCGAAGQGHKRTTIKAYLRPFHPANFTRKHTSKYVCTDIQTDWQTHTHTRTCANEEAMKRSVAVQFALWTTEMSHITTRSCKSSGFAQRMLMTPYHIIQSADEGKAISHRIFKDVSMH